jgi:hypothetical protein
MSHETLIPSVPGSLPSVARYHVGLDRQTSSCVYNVKANSESRSGSPKSCVDATENMRGTINDTVLPQIHLIAFHCIFRNDSTGTDLKCMFHGKKAKRGMATCYPTSVVRICTNQRHFWKNFSLVLPQLYRPKETSRTVERFKGRRKNVT